MSWRNRLFNTAGGRTDCMGADDRWHSVPVDMGICSLCPLRMGFGSRTPHRGHYVYGDPGGSPAFLLFSFGDTPIYISVVLLPICLAVVVVRLPDFRLALDPSPAASAYSLREQAIATVRLRLSRGGRALAANQSMMHLQSRRGWSHSTEASGNGSDSPVPARNRPMPRAMGSSARRKSGSLTTTTARQIGRSTTEM